MTKLCELSNQWLAHVPYLKLVLKLNDIENKGNGIEHNYTEIKKERERERVRESVCERESKRECV